jgi:hypothetical protein
MGEMKNAHTILVRISEEKRLPMRSRLKWNNNIKTDLKGKVCKVVNFIPLAQATCFLNMVMNLQIFYKAQNFSDS